MKARLVLLLGIVTMIASLIYPYAVLATRF